MKRLIATRPILYRNTLYQAGDDLPPGADMAEIWVKAGSAEWESEPISTAKKPQKQEAAQK